MIIGIIGRARSGKDTFAEMLADALFEKTKRKFIMMAYATELKNRVQRDFDLSYEQLWGDQKEVADKRYPRRFTTYTGINPPMEMGYWTAREILQAYGQFYRTIDSQFWVNNLFNVIEEKEYNNVIITDVRHPNEAAPIKERGGSIIKVNRKNRDEIHGSQHISEVAMDDYRADFTVVNDSSLEELKKTALETVELLISTETLKIKTEDY